MGKNSLWKVVPQMGEVRNKGVEFCSQPGFWKVNNKEVSGSTCILDLLGNDSRRRRLGPYSMQSVGAA